MDNLPEHISQLDAKVDHPDSQFEPHEVQRLFEFYKEHNYLKRLWSLYQHAQVVMDDDQRSYVASKLSEMQLLDDNMHCS